MAAAAGKVTLERGGSLVRFVLPVSLPALARFHQISQGGDGNQRGRERPDRSGHIFGGIIGEAEVLDQGILNQQFQLRLRLLGVEDNSRLSTWGHLVRHCRLTLKKPDMVWQQFLKAQETVRSSGGPIDRE